MKVFFVVSSTRNWVRIPRIFAVLMGDSLRACTDEYGLILVTSRGSWRVYGHTVERAVRDINSSSRQFAKYGSAPSRLMNGPFSAVQTRAYSSIRNSELYRQKGC